MSAKTVLITGGSSGLGYETARRIARSSTDWHVAIASRDPGRCEGAAERLRRETQNPGVVAQPVDLSSLRSIRTFARDFRARGLPPVRAIVCNAGVQVVSGLTRTVDGLETTFAVNHLAHFLLVNLLIDALGPPARVVVVSSDTHDPAQRTGMPAPRWRDPYLLAYPERDPVPTHEGNGTLGRRRYTTTKLCNVLFAYELVRRIAAWRPADPSSVTVNAFNPGFMPGTALARDYPGWARLAWRTLLPAIARLRGHAGSVRSSADALADLVLAAKWEGVTGTYVDRTTVARSSEESYDELKAAQLWRASADLVGLHSGETPIV